jgi:hypothetical protein
LSNGIGRGTIKLIINLLISRGITSQEPGGSFCNTFGKEPELVAEKESHLKEMIATVEKQTDQSWLIPLVV